MIRPEYHLDYENGPPVGDDRSTKSNLCKS